MKPMLGCFCVLALLLLAIPVRAQRKILSPRDSVFLSLDTNTISVNYGRPSIRDRKIMGELVPWNEVWRTGANEATHVKTNFDMTMSGIPITRGTYTLWTIPSPTDWTIVVNKETGQWGTNYNEYLDLARFTIPSKHTEATVDTFTISLEPSGTAAGIMKLMWENTEVDIPFEKNTTIRPLSPLDSTEVSLNGKSVKIRYSRPSTRGRKIWGVVVPMDSIWRTGANAATSLTTETDLVADGTVIPKGSYTLYSLPTTESYTLIVSKKTGQEAQYDNSQDLARLQMNMQKAAEVIDPFTILLETDGQDRATLRLGWADREYVLPLRAR